MMTFENAMAQLPLVAILRGISPEECDAVGDALIEQGFTLIEVPLNSPDPLRSINRLNLRCGAHAVIGAGTVLDVAAVDEVAQAGGRLIVSPNMDVNVIARTRALGLVSAPGIATPSEGFAALKAGADILKLFPGEMITPAVLRAIRAVFPPRTRMVPVGGVSIETMAAYRAAGASGFGVGSSLYKPGMSTEQIRKNAAQLSAAWRAAAVPETDRHQA